MYKGVTHAGTFKNKSFLSNEFLRGAYAFGEHLGPVFLTINEQYTPKRKEELFSYLVTLPKDISFFLEVRHKDFFAKKEELESLLSFLREQEIGFVITDTAGRRDCAHMHLTVPKTFIRFVGNSLHPTDYARCDAWVRRIKSWLGKGLKELYFFMHMHDEATSPELTVYLADKLNETCGLNLVRPKFVDESLLR
jgi:uncharacterized protein YecE (DUF72 family)